MQICQKHWDMLRAAIETKGMAHLVAKSGDEAAARMKAEVEEGEAPYDPLLSCNWMITNRALTMGGLYLMTSDLCPICEVMKHMAGKPGDSTGRPWSAEEIEVAWIDGPTGAALRHCQEHKIL